MTCLEVKQILVRSLSVDYNEVSWVVQDTTKDLLDVTYQVLRSEAPAGPWEPVSPEMEDQYLFIDNRIKIGNRWRQYYYLIRVKDKASGGVKDHGPASVTPSPDLVGHEVRKHINLLMREFVGRRCWVLPVRTFGQRCPSCFNATLNTRTKSGCRTCYDTSFIRGYHHPIETWIQFDPSPKSDQPTNVGKLQQSDTTARLGYFPPLKPGDLIIEPENVRWRVSQVSATQRLRAPVHQEIQVHQVPKSDIEYLLDIDLGTGRVAGCVEEAQPISLKDLFLAGSRNYSNPHTLEAFENDESPGIFALYPSSYPRVKT